MRGIIPMSDLHAQIITKNGRGEYAILPYKEFLKLQEQLEDYEDLRCLREAKQAEKDAPTIGISELKKKKIARRTSRCSRRC
jgi:PHD/YefM family antitoxin component YafN of YafNO toxin-antitoxin module